MYSALINSSHVTPLASTLPTMFAKLSMVLSSIHFICSNRKIRSKINRSLFTQTNQPGRSKKEVRFKITALETDPKKKKVFLLRKNAMKRKKNFRHKENQNINVLLLNNY